MSIALQPSYSLVTIHDVPGAPDLTINKSFSLRIDLEFFWCPSFVKYTQSISLIKPVSYTHLDVYKRQPYVCSEKDSSIIATIEGGKAGKTVCLRADMDACLLYTSRCV